MRVRWLSVVIFGLCGLLAACTTVHGDARQPIPMHLVPAPSPAHRLMVVLPGRGDDLRALERSGVAAAIQQAWPDTDVLLAEANLAYYQEGRVTRRLHDEVVMPALARHRYSQVWMAGASLGGMGTLLYDQDWPGTLDGLVLLAPYLGEPATTDAIRASGGLARWNPAPAPANATTWAARQRELWRHLQGWLRDPAQSRRVWLAVGTQDRLRPSIELLMPALPADHVVVPPGGHAWSTWTPATGLLLRRARN